MFAEPAGQRLGELRDLVPQPALGQIGQRGRVASPAIRASSIARPETPMMSEATDGQLDPGVFEQLLQPLDLPAAFPGDRGAGAGQVPQLPDRLGRHERARTRPCAPSWASQVASATSVLRPGRFFTCRALTSITSTTRQVLQQVVERLPVVAGGLHHHTRDLLGDQMITQRQDLAGRRPPGRDRLDRLAPPGPATRTQTLASFFEMSSPAHRAWITSTALLPSPADHCDGVRRGEGRESRKSDARAQGTNPRFPWKPSATMLTYRLTGTKVDRGQPRRTPSIITPRPSQPQQATTAESSRTTVRHRRTAQEC